MYVHKFKCFYFIHIIFFFFFFFFFFFLIVVVVDLLLATVRMKIVEDADNSDAMVDLNHIAFVRLTQ